MATHLALAGVIVFVALGSLIVWLYRRRAPRENTDNWPVTEATIHLVGQALPSGRGGYPVDVGTFSYSVNGEYHSGRATISRSFSTGDGQPKDLLNKKFELRYDPRRPDKYIFQTEVDGFLLDPYDDFLMHDYDP